MMGPWLQQRLYKVRASKASALALLLVAFMACGCASHDTDALVAQLLMEEEAPRVASAPSPQPDQPIRGAPAPALVSATTPPAAEPSGMPSSESLTNVVPASVLADSGKVTIQPDTILQIVVDEDPTLTGRYLVNDMSAIDFGYVGLVLLNDMTPEEAAAKIKAVLESRYLRSATVRVRISKASYDRVYVGGEVFKPGMLKIGPGSTISLKDALMRVGGLKLQANTARVKIVREGLLSPFQAAAEGEVLPLVSDEGKPQVPDVRIGNNDLVYVFSFTPRALGEKQILLLGEVGNPRIVSFSNDEPCSLMYLLLKIGGLPRFAKTDSIRIVRRDKFGIETEIRANADLLLKEGKPEDDVPLQNGDKVIVPSRTLSLF